MMKKKVKKLKKLKKLKKVKKLNMKISLQNIYKNKK